jgi:hypothetical protein
LRYTCCQEISRKVDELIRCPNCAASLPDEQINSQGFNPCPICRSLIRADVFPAIYETPVGGTSGELLLVDNESSCFYHQNKQALTACASCGRFLCALCDIDFNGQHLCMSCIESGKKKGKIGKLQNSKFLYDNIVLGMAILPVFTFYLPVITAPTTIFLAIKYWNKTSGIIKRGRLRIVLALLIALMEIVGIVLIVYLLINHTSMFKQ